MASVARPAPRAGHSETDHCPPENAVRGGDQEDPEGEGEGEGEDEGEGEQELTAEEQQHPGHGLSFKVSCDVESAKVHASAGPESRTPRLTLTR